MISVIKRVFCLGPRSCSMKTRLNFNIDINPIRSVQYDGEIAESLLLDVKCSIGSSVRDKMRHVISYERSHDFPIKSILKHKRRSIHTFLRYIFKLLAFLVLIYTSKNRNTKMQWVISYDGSRD